jgi:hypothetical protein
VNLTEIGRSAIALLLMILLGFAAGWIAHNPARQEVKQLQAERRTTNENVVEAVQASVKVDDAIAADQASISDVRAKVAARLSQPVYASTCHDPDLYLRPESTAQLAVHDPVPGGVAVLDAGTVRLLNAARAGTELRAAGSGDGQEPAAAASIR